MKGRLDSWPRIKIDIGSQSSDAARSSHQLSCHCAVNFCDQAGNTPADSGQMAIREKKNVYRNVDGLDADLPYNLDRP
jgi:hypothetical protein